MPDQWERHACSKDGSGDRDSVPSRRQARDAAVADQDDRPATALNREEKALDEAVAGFSLDDIAEAALNRAEHLAHVVNDAASGDLVNALRRRKAALKPQAEASALARLAAIRAYCEAQAEKFGAEVFPVQARDMRVSAADILDITGEQP